jgi:hypothetical protein
MPDTRKDDSLEAYYRHIERRPSEPCHVESVANWMKGNKPLAPEESQFLNTWDDVISPRKRDDHGRLDDLLSPCIDKLFAWGFHKASNRIVGHTKEHD